MSWKIQLDRVSVYAYALHGDIAVKFKFQEPVMRRRIIEALTYPRMMLLANLDGEECSQNLYFNIAHEDCQICEQRQECLWLKINDEFSVLTEKTLDSLCESLQFCIDYVDAQCAHANHNVRRCPCESCNWVRSARRIATEYKHTERSH